jgi:type I site-specific restriction-modification system R (restriction) subunit
MEWMEKNYPPDASLPRFLLNQPPISKSSRSVSLPDIVMFHGYDPIVAIELKLELNAIRERDFFNDVEKIERLRDRHPKLKNAYLIFVYDHDEELEIDEVENWMLRFFFPIGINVRRTENGKLRRGYREWRDLWDRLYSNLSA